MATLSSPGLGSGIDVRSIIDKLMTLEKQPLVKISTRVVELQAQVSAYGALKSSVSSFRDAIDKLADLEKFKVFKATSSDEAVATVSASSTAARGVYNLEVLRVAENHRLAAGTTYGSTDTVIGNAGEMMNIAVGGAAFEVEVGGKSLAGIRDAINAATDNTGVTASILKDDQGYRLSLSSNDTGSAKALSISYSAIDPFALTTLNSDRDASGGFTSADLDASVKLEGQFTITSSSNTLSETLQGVSVTLKKAGAVQVNVERDASAVDQSAQDFVKAYNDLISTMSKMRSQTLKSDGAALGSIESQLRNVLSQESKVEGVFSNAFELGLSTQKNGQLSLDSKIFKSAMEKDYDGLANFFADGTQGLAKRLRNLADGFLETGALLDGRTQGLNNQITQEEAKKAALEQRLTVVEARLTATYNSLDSVVANLTATNNLLTQQLAGLRNLNE
ncbi:MAG TPA: flagellar filament capping protein FliD [Gammaproteobacteria bacterium]|nr:flagellar filament capping protein FliD [Gammaproteobacteria bacterium]